MKNHMKDIQRSLAWLTCWPAACVAFPLFAAKTWVADSLQRTLCNVDCNTVDVCFADLRNVWINRFWVTKDDDYPLFFGVSMTCKCNAACFCQRSQHWTKIHTTKASPSLRDKQTQTTNSSEFSQKTHFLLLTLLSWIGINCTMHCTSPRGEMIPSP